MRHYIPRIKKKSRNIIHWLLQRVKIAFFLSTFNNVRQTFYLPSFNNVRQKFFLRPLIIRYFCFN